MSRIQCMQENYSRVNARRGLRGRSMGNPGSFRGLNLSYKEEQLNKQWNRGPVSENPSTSVRVTNLLQNGLESRLVTDAGEPQALFFSHAEQMNIPRFVGTLQPGDSFFLFAELRIVPGQRISRHITLIRGFLPEGDILTKSRLLRRFIACRKVGLRQCCFCFRFAAEAVNLCKLLHRLFLFPL